EGTLWAGRRLLPGGFIEDVLPARRRIDRELLRDRSEGLVLLRTDPAEIEHTARLGRHVPRQTQDRGQGLPGDRGPMLGGEVPEELHTQGVVVGAGRLAQPALEHCATDFAESKLRLADPPDHLAFLLANLAVGPGDVDEGEEAERGQRGLVE